MTIEEIQTICKKYRGVIQDIKWENHLCFNVGAKMFLITAPDEVPCSASIKVPEENFEEIQERKGSCRRLIWPGTSGFGWMISDDSHQSNGRIH